MDCEPVVALGCLIGAIALFIAAIYMYDSLAMPAGFWLFGSRTVVCSEGRMFEERLHEGGARYAYMIWTWQWVFSIAVLLGLVGFLALLFDTGNWTTIRAGAVILRRDRGLYWLMRPRLGTD